LDGSFVFPTTFVTPILSETPVETSATTALRLFGITALTEAPTLITTVFIDCPVGIPDIFCRTYPASPALIGSGSPLYLTDDTVITIYGILVFDKKLASGGTTSFHHIGKFKEWLDQAKAEITPITVPKFTVDIVHYTSAAATDGIQRCIGTIISKNRVLTTASCVTADPSKKIAIRTYNEAVPATIAEIILETERVWIHPHYKGRSDGANVAVIEVS
jgi:hypothetical protein